MSNTTPATTTAADEAAAPKTQRVKAAKPAAPKDSKASKTKTVKAKAGSTKAAKTSKSAKPQVKTKAKAKPAPTPKAKTTEVVNKAPKVKKPKLVRDSFTMPKDEYAAIALLKTRSAALAQPAKKSELLRAGIKLLAGLNDKALLAALSAVPTLKTGRPAKS